MCIHFKYNPQTLLENIPPEDLVDKNKVIKFIEESDLCMGILTKRGNASIKSMVKVYKFEEEYNEALTLKA